MTNRRLLSLILLIGGLGALVPRIAAETPKSQPLACNMNALSREERQRYGALVRKLAAAAGARRALASGYELDIDRTKLGLIELAEWIDLESRCCPFLRFEVAVNGGTKLRLTGGKGVKEFLELEFGWR